MIPQSDTDEDTNSGWSDLLELKEQFIGGLVRKLKSTSANRPEAKILREGIKSEADLWRKYVRGAADARTTGPSGGEPTSWGYAAWSYGVDESGIQRLMDWGLLSPVTTLVLQNEVQRLDLDRTWWCDLVDIDPVG
jgi:hypothetical protein